MLAGGREASLIEAVLPPQVPRADTPSPQRPCGSGRSQIPQSAGGVGPTDFKLELTKRGVGSKPAGSHPRLEKVYSAVNI